MGKLDKLGKATIPKPPPITDVDKFVRKGATTPSGDKRGKVRVDSEGNERERIHAWVRVETKRALDVYCAERNVKAYDVVDEAVTEYLRKHKR